MRRLIVWGAGELGGAVAAAWVSAGGEAIGVTRGEARHGALRAAGVEPRLGHPRDVLRPDDALLLALPGSEPQTLAVGALRDLPPPARVVGIGTTGYYGTPHGRVDEDTPMGKGDHAARAAGFEAALRHWAKEAAVVLRLGGLYRQGRGPLAALARTQAVPDGPPDRTLALIHYEDAAAAALAALRHPAPQPVYLGVTPPCPLRQDFYLAACVLLDLPLPSFGRPLSRPPAEYDVRRLRADLLPAPRWPRWQAALVP